MGKVINMQLRDKYNVKDGVTKKPEIMRAIWYLNAKLKKKKSSQTVLN